MIRRTIYLNNIEELDLNNCGVHFSKDKNYSHNGGGSNGVTKKAGKIEVVISVLGGYNGKINEEATAISNANYPNEKEVVLNFNTKLTAWIKGEKVTINTGDRGDIWVKNLSK